MGYGKEANGEFNSNGQEGLNLIPKMTVKSDQTIQRSEPKKQTKSLKS